MPPRPSKRSILNSACVSDRNRASICCNSEEAIAAVAPSGPETAEPQLRQNLALSGTGVAQRAHCMLKGLAEGSQRQADRSTLARSDAGHYPRGRPVVRIAPFIAANPGGRS